MPIPLNVIEARRAQRDERGPTAPPTEDIREKVFELEAKGEWIVQRVPEPWVGVTTKYGRIKKIPAEHTWHHKSCGQCGHIPGYSTAIYWLNRALGFDYNDPKDQTSCTAWNYYASATSNVGAQAAVAMRNFGAAYESGYFPTIHCGTSYGHYKEVREELVAHADLRDEFAQRRVLDLSSIDVTVHPACHYHKLVVEDAIYDPDVYGGQRTAVVSAVVTALGANVKDYSTWFDCCGFGFRHILDQRDFTRSFATLRKIEVMREEANPDVVLTHDTGCVTTLDQSQFAPRAHKPNVGIPVMSEAQFAALAMGAHPYRVCQLHWHSTEYRPLLEKMGIDWRERWREFEDDLERLKKDDTKFLTWEDADA